MDGKPPVIEPPVLALLEEVCLAIVPLQGAVNITREAPLSNALGILVSPNMRLSEDILLRSNSFDNLFFIPGRIKLPKLI